MAPPSLRAGVLAPRAPGVALAQIIDGAAIGPRLPAPAVAEDAAPEVFLRAAAQALAAGRTGEAQEAMERAESRALDRAVRPSQARQPDHKPLVQQISEARAALLLGNRLGALRLLQAALRKPDARDGTE